MADIINLRTARKQKKRQEKQARAKTNRSLSSLPAKVRKAAQQRTLKAQRILDGHRLDGPSNAKDD